MRRDILQTKGTFEMTSAPIYEVSFDYHHSNKRRIRKRNKRLYRKSICVRAEDSQSSLSKATAIFSKLQPNASIVSVSNVVYPGTCGPPLNTRSAKCLRLIYEGMLSVLVTLHCVVLQTREGAKHVKH